jgi:two-component system, NarL family, invasion response regulator UvrY
MNDSPKILLIDNQPLMRQGLIYLIKKAIPHASINSAESLECAMPILKQHSFDLVVTEVLGGLQIGTCIVGMIQTVRPMTKVLVYSGFDEDVFATLFLKAGAMGFLSKRTNWDETVKAIRMVLAGQKFMSAGLQTKLLFENGARSPRFALQTERSLSRQEMAVMHLLLEGKSTKEIAYTLGLKDNAVSTFKQRIFKKLDVSSPVQLYHLASSQFHQP